MGSSFDRLERKLGLRLFLIAGARAILLLFASRRLGLFLVGRAAVALLLFFRDEGSLGLFLFARAAGAFAVALLFFSADEGGGEGEDTDGEGEEFEELGVHDGNIWLVNSSPSQLAGGHSGQ